MVEAAEAALAANGQVRALAGRGVAAGPKEVKASGKAAEGWFEVALAGNVRGRVELTAGRTGRAEPWTFSQLRLEVDRRGLNAVTARARAQAAAAAAEAAEAEGGAGSSAGGAAAAAAPEVPLEGNVPGTEEVIVFQLFPPVPAGAAAGAGGGGAAEGAAPELR